jgi:hypothetical protein
MAAPEEINADMLSFWNGKGGDTWVARQEHTDTTLTPVTDALVAFAARRAGERVVDIGCGCLWRAHAGHCAPSVPPAAWWGWTSPGRCWPRVRGARARPASPSSIGDRPIPPRPGWMNTICLNACRRFADRPTCRSRVAPVRQEHPQMRRPKRVTRAQSERIREHRSGSDG